MEKPIMEQASFEFSQEGNCLNNQDAAEFLKIECMGSLGIDREEKCFYVLKTEGWSIDSVLELQELFDRIHKSLFPLK
jgi:hypothetical protein